MMYKFKTVCGLTLFAIKPTLNYIYTTCSTQSRYCI